MKQAISVGSTVAEQAKEGLKAAVCHLLDMTEERYAEMQYEAGVKYLDIYIPDDPAGSRQLLGTRSYWGWWVMNWLSRDKAFVTQDVHLLSYSKRVQCYEQLHNPVALASSIYPGRLVLDLSYSQMIQSLFDHEMPQI